MSFKLVISIQLRINYCVDNKSETYYFFSHFEDAKYWYFQFYYVILKHNKACLKYSHIY